MSYLDYCNGLLIDLALFLILSLWPLEWSFWTINEVTVLLESLSDSHFLQAKAYGPQHGSFVASFFPTPHLLPLPLNDLGFPIRDSLSHLSSSSWPVSFFLAWPSFSSGWHSCLVKNQEEVLLLSGLLPWTSYLGVCSFSSSKVPVHNYLLICYYVWLDEKLCESRGYVSFTYSVILSA